MAPASFGRSPWALPLLRGLFLLGAPAHLPTTSTGRCDAETNRGSSRASRWHAKTNRGAVGLPESVPGAGHAA